jgi:hypothetical protein
MSRFKFIGTVYGIHSIEGITYAKEGDLIEFDIKDIVDSDRDGELLKVMLDIGRDFFAPYWLYNIRQLT